MTEDERAEIIDLIRATQPADTKTMESRIASLEHELTAARKLMSVLIMAAGGEIVVPDRLFIEMSSSWILTKDVRPGGESVYRVITK